MAQMMTVIYTSSNNHQCSAWGDAATGHEGEIIVHSNAPATNTNDNAAKNLEGKRGRERMEERGARGRETNVMQMQFLFESLAMKIIWSYSMVDTVLAQSS